MKKIIICVLALTLLLSACSSDVNKSATNTNANVSSADLSSLDETSSEVNSSVNSGSEYDSAILKLMDVVNNKKKFISTENGQRFYLDDFKSSNYLYIDDNGKYTYTDDLDNTIHEFVKFCIVDMDSDNTPELILESLNEKLLVLHIESDVVYGYVFPYRGMESIKKDGTFVSSGGAAIQVVESLKFTNDVCNFDELCYFDGLDNKYRIDTNPVKQKDAEEYLKNQEKKENVDWLDLNKSNIEKVMKSSSKKTNSKLNKEVSSKKSDALSSYSKSSSTTDFVSSNSNKDYSKIDYKSTPPLKVENEKEFEVYGDNLKDLILKYEDVFKNAYDIIYRMSKKITHKNYLYKLKGNNIKICDMENNYEKIKFEINKQDKIELTEFLRFLKYNHIEDCIVYDDSDKSGDIVMSMFVLIHSTDDYYGDLRIYNKNVSEKSLSLSGAISGSKIYTVNDLWNYQIIPLAC